MVPFTWGATVKMVADVTPIAALAGSAAYVALRVAYLAFYLRLRATPEEVGYGYSEILAGALLGAVWLVFLLACLGTALGTAGRWLLTALVRPYAIARRFLTRWLGLRRAARWRLAVRSRIRALGQTRLIGAVAARLAIRRRLAHRFRGWTYLASVVVLIGLPALAWEEGGLAAQGLTVRMLYVRFVGVPVVPLLAVQAESARIIWSGDAAGPGAELSARPCLMYLGDNTHASVFYDVRSGESLRVPSADISVVLSGQEYVPDECLR